MKKIILPILVLLITLTSCQKEDDLLTPIPPPPPNVENTNTNTTTNTGVYVVEPSPSFIGEGKKYDITLNEFNLECSELTPFNQDTSYSYTDINVGEANFTFSDSANLTTTTYPQNSSYAVPHSVNFSNYLVEWTIDNYYYNEGNLTMDLQRISCTGEILVEWQVVMLVTEYSDGSFDLSINQNGYETQQNITWNSQLKLHLVEKK
jgi:hypothetical protein|tara:strand:+ start:56 stop:673 length:618 start_codon:yes stop_codon:yes gene_type:complete